MAKYKKVTAGGTFDRLHVGHEALLRRAFEVADEVAIGITSDEFVRGKELGDVILPYSQREKEVRGYVERVGSGRSYEVIKLDDVYGTTLSDGHIRAMVVSEETRPGAEIVNHKRQELGMTPLPLEMVDLVADEEGERISSERIRQGIVSREGRVYAKVLEQGWKMGGKEREQLKQPMAELVQNDWVKDFLMKKKPTKIALVGDQCLLKFEELGLAYDLAVFDGRIQRREEEATAGFARVDRLEAENEAGRIEMEAVRALARLVKGEKKYLRVIGEEDLLVLPLIMLLPLRSVVVYGQPGEGSVVVEVSEENKRKWYEFLK